MGPVVVVVVLPFLEFLVERAGVVLNDAVEQAVELFGVDAVRTLHFSAESGGGRPDVDMADALVSTCQRKLDWKNWIAVF
jgi:hypothetical protein